MKKALLRGALAAAIALAGREASAGGGGSYGGGAGAGGGGGGSTDTTAAASPTATTPDTGDLYGDLLVIRRDAVTGQPILERRLVLLPEDVYGWAYCPVAVDAAGLELPFLPDSCDLDPASAGGALEVSFGRLSGVRTQERNLRMHLDEVIGKIKEAQAVRREEAGRLTLGTGCTLLPDGAWDPATCTTWTAVDAPLENLALYHRLMKYGHLQTDPAEVDTWFKGDPATGTVYHVALEAADWAKLDPALRTLLPAASAAACFADVAACVAPQVLDVADFGLAAGFLGAGAGKHDEITLDVVQYMNRILRLTCGDSDASRTWCLEPTETRTNPANSLPALVRDCYDASGAPGAACRIYPADQPVETAEGVVVPAASGFPANERLVNFGPIVRADAGGPAAARYERERWFGAFVSVLRPVPGTAGIEWRVDRTWLPDFLALKNPDGAAGDDVRAFVNATRDAVRAVEFVHEYEVPADLGFFPY